jgi:LysM repeat protein
MRTWISSTVISALIAGLLACGVAFGGQKGEPTVYIVKKGDTLWGLSNRFMKDPYYWPDLWARNPEKILNPHFIFPGQKLKIYPDRIEVENGPKTSSPQPAAESAAVMAVPAIPGEPQKAPDTQDQPVDERRFSVSGGEGFIAGAGFKPIGKVIAGQHNRQIFAADDIVYTDIGSADGGKVGDRFNIYKKFTPISHPVSNAILGYKVVPLGILQLTEMSARSSKALLTESFLEVEPGAALLPYTGSKKKEVALRAPELDLTGYIIETRTGAQAISAGDIAYIDLGEKQGVKAGNLFYVVRKAKVEIDYFSNSEYDLPIDVLGAVVVVETAENTSTVLVVKSIDTIYTGDRLEMKKGR